jgi:beta-glucanase (GH16 family)
LKIKIFVSALLCAIASFFLAAQPANAQVQTWNLTFSNVYNGAAGVFTPTSGNNPDWSFDTGEGVFGTGEIEDMIDDGTTSYLDGSGHLVIKTYETGTTYYSARMRTQMNGSFGHDFTYGRVESSMQIATTQGLWPAFWMLGDNGVTWPGNGEIDIMEENGSAPQHIRGTIHATGYANTGLGIDSFCPNGCSYPTTYHTYGVIWAPYLVEFYVDTPATPYIYYTPADVMGVGSDAGASTLGEWPFYGHPFYVLYDVAVGGGFPGPPGANTVMPQFTNISYTDVFTAPAPGAATGLTATATSNSQVQLNWTASSTSGNDPELTYNIFRSTTPGAEYPPTNTNMSMMIATGVAGTSFTDTMLTPGTTYYYEVTASGQESGESPVSNQAAVTTPTTGTNVKEIAIKVGALVGWQNFVQDIGYTGGATNAYANLITTTGVTNAAPEDIYRTERWGPSTYVIPDLTPGAAFTVRIHMAEVAFTAAGDRCFNTSINGTAVMTNYDIFAHAGGEFIANVASFSANADTNGKITIAFTAGTCGDANPSVRGLEIIPVNTCSVAPSAPTGLTATAASTTDVNLSWTASTSGTGCSTTYNVYRSTTSGFTAGSGNQIATGVSSTAYSDTSVSASTTYYYLVEGVDSAGSSAPSSQATATTPCAVPAAPTGLGATAASSSQINLSWTATTSSCSGITYNVFRSTTSGFTAGSGNEIASGVTTTTYSNTGLTASTTYYYLVEAVDSGGTSGPSNQATATTPAPTCAAAPTAPSGLGATAISSSQINLSWTASTAGTACSITYSVFRSTTNGFTAGSGNQIASGLTTTSYSNTGLTASTTYFYLVEGVDAFGSSAASNQASATTSATSGSCTSICIDSGSTTAVSPFVADKDFTGGGTISHTNTINTSKVTNPAPVAVYQKGRDGNFTYTIGGFTAGSMHTLRLHFAETYWTAAGKREFNASINGTTVLTHFDIFATAGGENIANIQQFSEAANASGQYVIVFTSVIDNSLINGIEID